jgi:hypothetical protein
MAKTEYLPRKNYLYPSEQTIRTLPEAFSELNGHSSEIGFRVRGALTNRLFYGVEGNFLLSRNRKKVEFFADDVLFQRSTEAAKINRGSVGFGWDYLLRPRTIFSFDLSGGLTGTNALRNEDSIGNTLEKRARRSGFFSAHAAISLTFGAICSPARRYYHLRNQQRLIRDFSRYFGALIKQRRALRFRRAGKKLFH